jgi:hypothetical protein
MWDDNLVKGQKTAFYYKHIEFYFLITEIALILIIFKEAILNYTYKTSERVTELRGIYSWSVMVGLCMIFFLFLYLIYSNAIVI